MNKFLITTLVAMGVSASVFAATSDATAQYNDWCTGIGESASAAGELDPVNGTWSLGGSCTFENSMLKLDLDAGQDVRFTPDADKAPDTNTITRIYIDVEFGGSSVDEPVPTSGQCSVMVFDNKFYAWVGGDSWVALSGANPHEGVNKFVIEIKYSGVRSARFGVVGDSDNITWLTANDAEWLNLVTTADSVTYVAFDGKGDVAQVDCDVMLGVAKIGDVKYGTVAEAINAAKDATGAEVEIVRATAEQVTLAAEDKVVIAGTSNLTNPIAANENSEVTVEPAPADLGSGVSGDYAVALNVQGGKVGIKSPFPNKEIVGDPVKRGDGKYDVTIQTAKSVLSATQVGGTTLDLANSNNEGRLRELLDTYAKAAYISAEASPSTMADALNQTVSSAANNFTLWQNYALGVTPAVSVTPIANVVADKSNVAIVVGVANVVAENCSDDFAIQYVVEGKNIVEGNIFTDPAAIQIPKDTGVYDIKVKFVPATK